MDNTEAITKWKNSLAGYNVGQSRQYNPNAPLYPVEASSYLKTTPAPATPSPNTAPKMVNPPAVITSGKAQDKMNDIAKVVSDTTKAQNESSQIQEQEISPLQSYQQGLTDLDDTSMLAYDQYKEQVDRIQNGTIPLSTNEQAILDNLKLSFDRTRELQERANKNYERAVTKLGIMKGLQRYSPVLAEQNIQEAITTGLNKIQDLDSQAALTMNEIRQKFVDGKIKSAKESYDAYIGIIDEKRKTMTNMYEKQYEYEKDLRDREMEERKFDLDMEKFYLDRAKTNADIANINSQMSARERDYYSGALSDTEIRAIDTSPQGKKLQAAASLFDKYNKYNTLVKEYGFEVSGQTKAMLDQAYADLKIAYKEAANLGALTGPDVTLIEEAIKPASGGLRKGAIFALSGGKSGLSGTLERSTANLKENAIVSYKQLVSRNPKYEESDYVKTLIAPFSTPYNDYTPEQLKSLKKGEIVETPDGVYLESLGNGDFSPL